VRIILVLSFVFFACSQEASHYLNLSGFSYHFERETDDGKKFNEINYGLGYRYMYQEKTYFRYSFDAGFYYDSGFYWTKYLLINLQPKIYENLYLGIYLGLIQTLNLNDGDILFASIPGLSYHFETFDINLIYFPKIESMNRYDAIAFFASIKL
jgi:hypothetical protein